MAEMIVVILFAVVYFVGKVSLINRVDHYPIDRVDSSKMVADKVRNNLSNAQVQRNMVNGKYDKK